LILLFVVFTAHAFHGFFILVFNHQWFCYSVLL